MTLFSISRALTIFGVCCAASMLPACANKNAQSTDANTSETSPSPQAKTPDPLPELRHVVLMIGDGMGPQQVGLLELYARYAGDPRYPNHTSHIGEMIRNGTLGIAINAPADGLVIESASGATQLGSGVSTNYGSVGLDLKGDPAKSAVVIAKEHGLGTGLVSDTRITHATPAAFAAHTKDRWDETSIAIQMLETAPDLMFSGGWRYFLPQGIQDDATLKAKVQERYNLPEDRIYSVRKDNKNLLETAEEQGYTVITSPQDLQDIRTLPILGLFASNGMQNGEQWWAEQDSGSPTEPALSTMAMRAIELLSHNDNGFFLMVEGGQIDWACHRNQAQRLLYELLRFDEAVGRVQEWAKDRDDTLVIVTADHETGGFTLHYDKDGPPDATLFDKLDESDQYVSWAATTHSHTPVYTIATGHTQFTSAFSGLYHQSQQGEMMIELIQSIHDNTHVNPAAP